MICSPVRGSQGSANLPWAKKVPREGTAEVHARGGGSCCGVPFQGHAPRTSIGCLEGQNDLHRTVRTVVVAQVLYPRLRTLWHRLTEALQQGLVHLTEVLERDEQ